MHLQGVGVRVLGAEHAAKVALKDLLRRDGAGIEHLAGGFLFGLSSVFTVELDLLPFLELEILLGLLHLRLHLSLRSPNFSLLSLIVNVLERGPHLVKTGQWRHNELIFII
jgi:hypothetical protein